MSGLKYDIVSMSLLTFFRSDQSQSSSSHRVDSDRQGHVVQASGGQQHDRLNRQINRPDGFPIGYNTGRLNLQLLLETIKSTFSDECQIPP